MHVPIPLKGLFLADRNLLCTIERYYRQHPMPTSIPPNAHSHDCYEIYLLMSGDISFLVNDKLYAAESGDVLIARPGEMHVSIKQSPCEYESYCFWFLPLQPTPLSAFADGADMHHHIRFRESDRNRLKDMFRQLYRAETEGSEAERTAWVYHLLALLNSSAVPEQVSVTAPIPDALQRILTYLNDHFTQLCTVGEIADRFYISTATLNRWFRSYLQMTPKSYLETRRLSYSKHLLNQGLPVTEVCDRAGFPSCSRFISVFKKTFGITPLQYRKQCALLRSEQPQR